MLIIFIVLAPAGAAAQTNATTTDIGMITGLNLPWGVQILPGTAISSVTGNPVRHVWEGDAAGFCRIDPDLDSPGPYTVNTGTCVTTVAGVRFTPGRTAFDPTNNNVYTVNNAKSQPIARLHFLPDGDSGQGVMSFVSEFLGDATGCGVSGNLPWAITLGPDADLYVSFRKNGNIVRILGPQSATVPCNSFQTMGSTGDGKIGKGLGWIGHDLWGADGIGLFRIGNADQCFTPTNNFTPCKGINLLVALLSNPLSMFSDQNYPATNGSKLYVFDPTGTSISLVSNINTNPTVQPSWVPGIQTGLTIAVDSSDPANEVLYLGSDPAIDVAGVVNTGWVDKIVNAPPTTPETPIQVSALAGDGQATVSWASGGGGAATSYTVHNSFASNGLTVPDITVSAAAGFTFVPTSVVVTGLTDGVSYQFEVSASNSFGTSLFSLPSNSVIPHAVVAPTAPGAVVASAGNGTATVAWSVPTSNGGLPITSYTVSSYIGGVPTGLGVFVAAPATSTTVSGLTNGTTYTFSVHATNTAGNSPESLQSNAVTPVQPQGVPDLALTMTAGPTPNLGGNITYTLVVTNLGPTTAPSVTLSDPLPVGTTFVSAATAVGVCAGPPQTTNGGVQCLMSGLPAGGTWTVAVTLTLNATTTVNSALVQSFDLSGAPLIDPNPLNNTAAIAIVIAAPSTTTDIQTVGAAQNGGPTVGSIDTFTWQIKNNQSPTANQVTFSSTLPASLLFQSVTSTLSTCVGPAPGTSGTITCSAASIGGGQTMTVIVNVSVAASGTIPITGFAQFNGTDANPSNNAFTVTINAK